MTVICSYYDLGHSIPELYGVDCDIISWENTLGYNTS